MAVGCFALLTALGAQERPAPEPRTTNDGVYSQAQADRGRVLFTDVCLVCHTDPFWRPGWRGRPVAELYTKILKLMPDDNPGTLTGEETAAALAYILSSNGAPAGPDSLPADPAILDRITVVEPPK